MPSTSSCAVGAIIHWTQQPRTKDDIRGASLVRTSAEIDPNNADAGRLGAYYMIEYSYGWSDPETDYDAKILGQADRAIAAARATMFTRIDQKPVFAPHTRPPKPPRRRRRARINPNSALLLASPRVAENYSRQFQQAKLIPASHALSPRDPR